MGYSYATGPIFNVQTGESLKFGMYDSADQAWIVMHPAVTVRGRVIDEDDQPVTGARVKTEFPTDDVRTNENGEFAIERCVSILDARDQGGVSTRGLVIHHPDFVVDRFNQAVYSDAVTLRVRRGVLITGRMTELETGTPMPDGVVTARTVDDEPQPLGYFGYFAHSDAAGQYRLRLPRSVELADLTPFVDKNQQTGSERPLEATEQIHRIALNDEEHLEVDFTFRKRQDSPALKAVPSTRAYVPPPGYPAKLDGVSGTLIDEHGKPVVLGRIGIIDLETPLEPAQRMMFRKSIGDTARTDLSGRFRCAQVDPAQRLAIIAWDRDFNHVDQILTQPGTKSVELRLVERTARLAGTVRDERGKPIQGISVTLTFVRPTVPKVYLGFARGITDAQGRYEIAGYHVPPDGLSVFLDVGLPALDWSDPPERGRAAQRVQYVYFPVKPGETLDGLDYIIEQRGLRLVTPTREVFTREP
jgi:hypothetical protein